MAKITRYNTPREENTSNPLLQQEENIISEEQSTIGEPIVEPIVEPIATPPQEEKVEQPMAEIKNIVIKLEKPAYITFIIQNTGEVSPRIIHDQKIALSRGTIYKIPVTDNSLDLQASYVIRPKEKIADTIRILNVKDGLVTIEPLIHGVVLNNNDYIADLI
jgi:hypothetical protein